MIVKTLALYLEYKGLGTTAQDLFTDYLPDSPDNAICLYTTGGVNVPSSNKLGYDSPTFQVRSRNVDAEAAHNAIMNVYGALQGIANTTISGVYFVSIQALQTYPAILGRDSAQRTEYTQNFVCEIRNKTEHRN